MPVCTHCLTLMGLQEVTEPERVDPADWDPMGEPAGTPCSRCGGLLVWFRTIKGKWVALDPGRIPATKLPAEDQWYAKDGVAHRPRQGQALSMARFRHALVCGREPAPDQWSPLFNIWASNTPRL